MDNEKTIIRFLLNLPTEDPSFVDVEFEDDKQAKRAMNQVVAAQGAVLGLANASDVPVILRTELIAAAFVIEYDEDEGEDDD